VLAKSNASAPALSRRTAAWFDSRARPGTIEIEKNAPVIGDTLFTMTTTNDWFRHRKAGVWLMLALTATVAAGTGVCEMRANAISFDGALNAQVAANLLESGRYGIGYPEIQDFDHRIQTGPTVVLPVALSFGLFGVGSAAAQLPNLFYFVAFLMLVVYYAFRHAGPAGALLAFLLVLQTPGLVTIGLGIYGEIPALVFFLAALLLLDHVEDSANLVRAAASGFFLGLSVLTKIVMLIPVSWVLLVILVGVVIRRNIRLCDWAGVLGGFTMPLAAFEAVKLAVLTPPIWVEWWAVMVHRVAGQGLPLGMADTAGALPKLDNHLGILSNEMGVAVWPVLVLVVAPTFLLLLLWRRDQAAKTSPGVVPISVLSLWLAASSYLAWWLLLTPTSRAWLRRIIDGLLLQEILASILLVWAASWIFRAFRDRRFGSARDRARLVATATSAGLLLLAVSALVGSNLPQLELSMEPTPTRRSIDAMVATMRSLPDEAVFYGKGWYRAPVFALLSERVLRDFNKFPVSSYEEPLDDTFFVVDNHMLAYRSREVEAVLKRTVNEPIFQSATCDLYRLERVLPYPPIPKPDEIDDLSTMSRPKEGKYPFVGGLGAEAPNGRHSHAVSGFLLERDDRGCLLVDLWASSKVGEKPTLEVRVDYQPVHVAEPVADHRWRQVFTVGEDIDPDTPGSLVELWMFVDRKPQRFSLWSSDKNTFVVREVGFVPCSESDQNQADRK